VLSPAPGPISQSEAEPPARAQRRERQGDPERNQEGDRVRRPHQSEMILSGAEETVAGVSQPGNDVPDVVKLPVYGCHMYVNVGVGIAQVHNPLR